MDFLQWNRFFSEQVKNDSLELVFFRAGKRQLPMFLISSCFLTLFAITSLASCLLFRVTSTVRGFGLSLENFASLLSSMILPWTPRVCRIQLFVSLVETRYPDFDIYGSSSIPWTRKLFVILRFVCFCTVVLDTFTGHGTFSSPMFFRATAA